MSSSISASVLRWALRHQLDAEALHEIPQNHQRDLVALPLANGDLSSVLKHMEKLEKRFQPGEAFDRSPPEGFAGHIFRYTRQAKIAQKLIYDGGPPLGWVEKGEPFDLKSGTIFAVYWSVDRQWLVKEVRGTYMGFRLSREAITRVRDDVISGAAIPRNDGYVVTSMYPQGHNQLLTRFARGTMLLTMQDALRERAHWLGQSIAQSAQRRYPHLDIDPAAHSMTYTPDAREYVEWFDPVFGLRGLEFDNKNLTARVAA
jgi:hypothetical protein